MQNTVPAGDLLCPIRYALDIVGGKWKLPIICLLANGEPTRNGVIKRRLPGITNMMLSQSLKDLEAAGIVDRTQYNEIPPRVEYTLTREGKELLPVLQRMAEWGAEKMSADKGAAARCDSCQSNASA